MKANWPRLTQADFEWKLAQLNAYCSYHELHKAVGPCLELGTCVAGRLLLEFIGIKAAWKEQPYKLTPSKKLGYDVNCTDFEINLHPCPRVGDPESEILLNFIIRAHRIAHFTRDNEPDRYEWTCKGVPIIDRLFREHFYNKVKDQLPVK